MQPTSIGPGLQETFWLYPQNLTYGKWPASGEIDFAEFYSQYPNLDVPSVHYNDSSSDPNVTSDNCDINPALFNTYGVDWTPTSITVLYNGISGSNAVSANTPLPATTQIDWVRAWTPAS